MNERQLKIPVKETAPVATVRCQCSPKSKSFRDVPLYPSLAPGFVVGHCSGCNKPHTYAANAIPKPEPAKTFTPAKTIEDGANVAGDADLDIITQGDEVKIVYKGKRYNFGKLQGDRWVKFENENGIHKTTDSFGIPNALLKWLEQKKVPGIRIVHAGMHYDTTTARWRERGFFLYFKGRAEKRIYLRRADFK